MHDFTQNSLSAGDTAVYACGMLGSAIARAAIIFCLFFILNDDLSMVFSDFISLLSLSLLFECPCAMLTGLILDVYRHSVKIYRTVICTGTALAVASVIHIILGQSSDSISSPSMLVCFFILNIAFCAISIPYFSLLSRFSSNIKIRSRLAVVPTISNYMGRQLLMFSLAFFVVSDDSFSSLIRSSLQGFLAGACALLLLSQFVMICFTGMRPHDRSALSRRGLSTRTAATSSAADAGIPQRSAGSDVLTEDIARLSVSDKNASLRYKDIMYRNRASFTAGSVEAVLSADEAERFYAASDSRGDGLMSGLPRLPHLRVFDPEYLRSSFRVLLRNDQLMITLFIYIMQLCCFSLIFSSMMYSMYNHETLPANYYFLLLVSALPAQILGMLLYPVLSGADRRTQTFSAANVLFAVSYICLLILVDVSTGKASLTVTLFIISNISIGIAKVALASMVADTVDYGEFRLSTRSDGVIAAYMAISLRLSLLVVSNILHTDNITQFIDSSIGFIKTMPLTLITDVTMISAFTILVLLIYYNFFKLNGPFYRNILNNLQFLRHNQINRSTGISAKEHDSFMLRYSLDNDAILIKLKADSADDLMYAMVQKLSDVQAVSSEHDFMSDLKVRLSVGPCGIAEGIAIPHAKSPAVIRPTVVVATLDRPLDLGAMDDRPCDLIFMLASPDDGYTHLNLLGRLSLLLNEPGFADLLRSSGSPAELFERLIQCEKNIVH